MPVNDVLYSAVMAAKDAGEATRLWIDRSSCGNRCWLIAAYEIRGQRFVVSTKFRLSPTLAEQYGIDRDRPREVWVVSDLHSDELLLGCRHSPPRLAQLSVSKQGDPHCDWHSLP